MESFSVNVQPVSQPRARVTTRGKFAHAYVPEKHRVHDYRKKVAAAAVKAGVAMRSGPVFVDLLFVFERPKSHRTKSGLSSRAPALPREDGDNLAKAVVDCLTGVAWEDDTIVADWFVRKRYGKQGLVRVEISDVDVSDWEGFCE